jgi:hypothetical protein
MTQDDWTRWGNQHPWIAGLMQLGIYGLCWAAFFLGLGLVAAFLWGVVEGLKAL